MSSSIRLIVSFFAVTCAIGVHAQSAKEIMKNAEELTRIESMKAQVTLTSGVKSKVDKTKVFDSWRKLRDDGVHYNTLTRITSPAEIKDEAILMQEFPGNENNVFFYLPKFRKTRRVEGYDQGKSFMGTVFSYSDIATFHHANYNYKMIRADSCDPNPGDCNVLESRPATEEVKKRTRYSKSLIWVSKKTGLVQRTDAYDLDGKLIKRIFVLKYAQAADGKSAPVHVKAVRLDDQKFSTLTYKNPKFGVNIDDSIFSEEALSSIP